MILQTKKENKFTYIDQGEGEPMVLLHGLMGGLSNFSGMMDFFSQKGYRVIIPQLPIYDLSVLNTNLSALSKYVAKFIKEIIQQPVTIVGNSMGGHIGLILATTQTELVKNLVLTGSSGLYERPFGDSFPRKSDKTYIRKKIEEVFFDPKTATDELVDEVFGIVNDRMKGVKIVMLARSAIKHNMKDEMPQIQCPTCIIWGRQDNVTPPDVAEDMHKYIPNSDLFWVENCGHAAMMEHPDQFNQILYQWLKDKK